MAPPIKPTNRPHDVETDPDGVLPGAPTAHPTCPLVRRSDEPSNRLRWRTLNRARQEIPRRGRFHMRHARLAMAAAALVLCCGTVARAATLYTAPAETLVAPDAETTHRLCCDILNAGSRTADVTLR